MLVIRLQRTGRSNVATFRLVVTEHTNPVRGRVKEYLGYYLPTRNPHVFECDAARVSHWVGFGARPSVTAARLLKKAGLNGMDTFIKTYSKKKKKNAPPEEVKPVTPPAATAVKEVKESETPQEEAPKPEDATSVPEGDKGEKQE